MHPFHWPWHHPIHHHHHRKVVLTVGSLSILLIAGKTIHMATTLNVGQKLPLSIAYLDQNGNPMSPTPTPDSPPAWSNSNPATATLAAAPDGNSATETGVAAGVDVVSLSVTVAGQTFAAQLSVTVTQVVQVLTSVEIVAGTPA